MVLYVRMNNIHLYEILLKILKYRYNFRVWNHDAPIDLFKISFVDPKKITRITGRGKKPYRQRFRHIGKISEGDWDKRNKTKLLLESKNFRMIKKRYNENYEWDDIKILQSMKKAVQNGESRWHGCTTVNEIQNRCERMDNLYESIRTEGYKTARQLAAEKGVNFNHPIRLLDEVSVDVGRDGELLFVDGTHRFAIARSLGLDKIPVLFIARHKLWMNKRQRFYHSGNHPSHPDLCEIIN